MESGWEMCGGRGEGVVRWWVVGDGRAEGRRVGGSVVDE
jgi:hypothetical protein